MDPQDGEMFLYVFPQEKHRFILTDIRLVNDDQLPFIIPSSLYSLCHDLPRP